MAAVRIFAHMSLAHPVLHGADYSVLYFTHFFIVFFSKQKVKSYLLSGFEDSHDSFWTQNRRLSPFFGIKKQGQILSTRSCMVKTPYEFFKWWFWCFWKDIWWGVMTQKELNCSKQPFKQYSSLNLVYFLGEFLQRYGKEHLYLAKKVWLEHFFSVLKHPLKPLKVVKCTWKH